MKTFAVLLVFRSEKNDAIYTNVKSAISCILYSLGQFSNSIGFSIDFLKKSHTQSQFAGPLVDLRFNESDPLKMQDSY